MKQSCSAARKDRHIRKSEADLNISKYFTYDKGNITSQQEEVAFFINYMCSLAFEGQI